MALPTVGDPLPPLSLPNQDGRIVTLDDFRGQRILVWFFSRAFGSN